MEQRLPRFTLVGHFTLQINADGLPQNQQAAATASILAAWAQQQQQEPLHGTTIRIHGATMSPALLGALADALPASAGAAVLKFSELIWPAGDGYGGAAKLPHVHELGLVSALTEPVADAIAAATPSIHTLTVARVTPLRAVVYLCDRLPIEHIVAPTLKASPALPGSPVRTKRKHMHACAHYSQLHGAAIVCCLHAHGPRSLSLSHSLFVRAQVPYMRNVRSLLTAAIHVVAPTQPTAHSEAALFRTGLKIASHVVARMPAALGGEPPAILLQGWVANFEVAVCLSQLPTACTTLSLGLVSATDEPPAAPNDWPLAAAAHVIPPSYTAVCVTQYPGLQYLEFLALHNGLKQSGRKVW